MDAKITKLRLSRMLSYDWLKIVLSAAAMIVVWLLVFTITGTGVMPSQQFTVMNFVGNTTLSSGEFYDLQGNAFKDNIFSYEVIEGTTVDLAQDANSASTLLQARAAIEEGDVIFVANDYDYRSVVTNKIVDEGTGETTYSYEFGNTYLQNFLNGYFHYVFDVKEYLADMRAFVGQYYEDYQTGTGLNEQQIKDDFNARTKKDKRFKKSAARAQGQKDEVVRIQKYRDALVKFEWYLDQGVVALTETTLVFDEDVEYTRTFSINMCPSEDKGGMTVDGKPAMSKLLNAISYKPVFVNEENELEYGEATAENMNVCLFDFGGVADTYEYESLLFVVYTIERYSAELCPEYIYA